MGKRRGKNKNQSRRFRRVAEKHRLEMRETRRWVIQNGLAVVMIMISAKTCQYAELDRALTERLTHLESQVEQYTTRTINLTFPAITNLRIVEQ